MYLQPQQQMHIKLEWNNLDAHCVHCRPMPHGQYTIRVSVDGVPFPDSAYCYGNINSGHCRFYVSFDLLQRCSVIMWNKFGTISGKSLQFSKNFNCHSFQSVWWRTPTINSLSPFTGPPGNILSLESLIMCISIDGITYAYIYIYKSPQAPCWQFEDGSTAMCTEATRQRAQTASMSDF